MLCDYDRDTLACRACGHVALRLPTFRECTATRVYLPRPMVGDALAWCLRAVGITEARVERCLGGASCGCDGRRRWLNRWGLLAVDRLERVLNSWARFTVGP